MAIIASLIPLFTRSVLSDDAIGLILSLLICLVYPALVVFYLGCSKSERLFMLSKAKAIKTKFRV